MFFSSSTPPKSFPSLHAPTKNYNLSFFFTLENNQASTN